MCIQHKIKNLKKATLSMVYLSLTFILFGCRTPQQNIEEYDAYWGSKNERGETGWCTRDPVPEEDFNFKDCVYATPERTVKGAECPK